MAKNDVITTQTQFVIVDCVSCGVHFGMTNELKQRRLEDHGDFWCPNGHRQHYLGKTEAQKLQERLEAESARATRLQAQADRERAAAEHARRQTAAAKGQVTKLRKRAAKGVCPCCTRQFVNVERHMATQHPEFVAEHQPEPQPLP